MTNSGFSRAPMLFIIIIINTVVACTQTTTGNIRIRFSSSVESLVGSSVKSAVVEYPVPARLGRNQCSSVERERSCDCYRQTSLRLAFMGKTRYPHTWNGQDAGAGHRGMRKEVSGIQFAWSCSRLCPCGFPCD